MANHGSQWDVQSTADITPRRTGRWVMFGVIPAWIGTIVLMRVAWVKDSHPQSRSRSWQAAQRRFYKLAKMDPMSYPETRGNLAIDPLPCLPEHRK